MTIKFNDFFGVFADAYEHLWIVFNKLIPGKIPDSWAKGDNGDVVLINGFGGSWMNLRTVANLADGMGFRVHVLKEIGMNFLPTEKASAVLEKYLLVKKISNATIIAHSKGGIVTKYFLANSTHSDKVRKAICIATPFWGTYLGYLNVFNSHELTPESELLTDLSKNTKVNKKIINIYPRIDTVVITNKLPSIPNAKNVEIDVVGHLRVLTAKATLVAIKEELGKN